MSDNTPDVTYTRNRLGQVTAVSDGAGSRSFTTSEDGRPLTESYTSGMLNGVTTTYGYDGLKRRASHSAVVGSSTLGVTYGYDGASRINSVTSGTDATAYTYAPNSSLITTVTQSHGGTPKQTTSKTYDNLNRLTQISATGSSVISSHGYTYNALNQRTEAQLQDGTKWNYGYDSLGQVTSAGRKWSDNSDVAGQQYGYAFDSIGNRTGTTVNGRAASYTANSVNQYTQRQVPGAIDIQGSADAAATVTVNLGATSRKGDYFYRAVSINNLLAPQYPQYPEIKITAVLNDGGPGGEDLVSEQSGHHYLARTPEVYTFDDDGNLLSDGRWQYSWDGENRLIAMESIAAVPEAAKKKLEFSYDGQSRRLEKKVYAWNGASYVLSSTKRYLYDGWNLLAELDGSNEVKQSYVWGIDLSGVMQGAGGVGGLLAIQNTSGSYYPTYDGNGNIMKLQKAADQSEVSSYQYGAFGEVVEARESGVSNPYRFSTKYQDVETGLLYYGLRHSEIMMEK